MQTGYSEHQLKGARSLQVELGDVILLDAWTGEISVMRDAERR